MLKLPTNRLDYPVLFTGQILFLLLGPLLWADGLASIGRIVLVVLFLGTVIATTGGSRRFVLFASIPAALAVVFQESSNAVLHLSGALLMSALLLNAFVRVLLDVFRHRVVSSSTIFGSLSGYLLLGSAFAMMFYALEVAVPGSFELHGRALTGAVPAAQLAPVLSYFSVVTLTTLGFGDLLPASPGSRSLAAVEALLGQIFLVVLVARLLSAFGRESEERP